MKNQKATFTLKGKRILIIDDETHNAENWRRLLNEMAADAEVVVGPDITDLKPRIGKSFQEVYFEGIVLDILFQHSERDAIADNRIAGIILWDLLERDFHSRGINMSLRSGPVLLATKNDPGDPAIRTAVDGFCAAHPGSDVCWGSLPARRSAMAFKVFGK